MPPSLKFFLYILLLICKASVSVNANSPAYQNSLESCTAESEPACILNFKNGFRYTICSGKENILREKQMVKDKF